MNNFHEDYIEMWRKTIATYGLETAIPEIDDFSIILEEHSKITEEESCVLLQPWLLLTDQFIYWLALFKTTLTEMFLKSEQDKEFNELLGVLSIVTSLAASQAISIRKLCILGHDTSARVVLRSLTETVDIILMIIHDVSIRKEYYQNQDADKARAFWNQYLRKKKLSIFYKKMFRNLDLPEEAAHSFEVSREGTKELMTQSTHSSWDAAMFSSIPVTFEKDRDALRSFLGATSQFSKSTLFHLCESIFFVSEFGYAYLIKNYGNSFIDFVKLNDKNHLRVSAPLVMFNLSSVIKDLYIKYYKEFRDDTALMEMAEHIFKFKK